MTGVITVGQGFDEGIGVVGLIANQSHRIEILKQRFWTGEIAGLSWRKHQLHRIAQRIDERVDFGAQSPAFNRRNHPLTQIHALGLPSHPPDSVTKWNQHSVSKRILRVL